jgi:hypothetical protein
MEETKTLVTSFEEACQLRGYDPEKCLPEVSMYPAQHQTALIAAAKMFVINEAINEGHQFDWNNFDEKKWFPWFDMELTEDNPSGFRFYVAYCGIDLSHVGSRLSYRTRAAAEHAGKTFVDIYREMMVIKK